MLHFDNFIMFFLVALLAGCIIETIRAIANYLAVPKQERIIDNSPYELNVLYCNGYDRTCYLNDYNTALELLAYYNLDTEVQSVLLFQGEQDITFGGIIDHSKPRGEN